MAGAVGGEGRAVKFKRAYHRVRSDEARWREQALQALLQASLGRDYKVRLTGFGAGRAETIKGSNPSPDIIITRESRLVAEVEVTGTRYPFYAIADKGLWLRTDKLRYALRSPHTERIIYVHLLIPQEFPYGPWLHWLPAPTALRFLDPAHQLELICTSSSKLREHYVAIPPRIWRREWHSLIRHIKVLAGNE
jgi:hypothetical protein